MVEDWLSDWRTGMGYWCVRLAEDGALIGVAGVRRTGDDHTYNLYYRFAASSWGNGYATEAARHAVQTSLTDPSAVVRALIRPTNSGSIAVAERVGLRQVSDAGADAGEHLRYVVSASLAHDASHDAG
jgi:ribosomal-protein-alanine N-acetyltransferase